MKLKLKSIILRTWIVGSVVWVLFSLIRDGSMGNAFLPPLVVGALIRAVVWLVDYYPKDPIDVVKLKKAMADALGVERTEDSPYHRDTLQAVVDGLEADYGRRIPFRHMVRLQGIVSASVIEVQEQRERILGAAAKEGKCVAVDSIRDSTIAGISPDMEPAHRDAVVAEIESLVAALRRKFGDSIPVDQAFRIQRELEQGRWPNLDD